MEKIREAQLFDGVDPEGNAYFDETRLRITDPMDKARLLDFLARGGLPILHAAGLAEDEFDNSKEDVPIVTVTDGNWIWERAQAYYLEHYGYGPDADFYAYIRSRNYQAAKPDEDALDAAREFLARQDRPT